MCLWCCWKDLWALNLERFERNNITMKKNTLAKNCFKGIGDLEHQLGG
jgi:hypothetical protein